MSQVHLKIPQEEDLVRVTNNSNMGFTNRSSYDPETQRNSGYLSNLNLDAVELAEFNLRFDNITG